MNEVKSLETVGYHYNLSISVINSKGIQDEDDEEDFTQPPAQPKDEAVGEAKADSDTKEG